MAALHATVRNLGGDTVEIEVYETIGADFMGGGIDAKAFRQQVKDIRAGTINLRLNSPGGSVTDGAAMLATLDAWRAERPGRRIEVDIDGIAASAASVLAMAGDVIRMASNALLMVHNPTFQAIGGADDFDKAAALLRKVKEQLIDAYCRRPNMDREQVAAWMSEETWFTAQEAVAAGLADSCGAPASVAAKGKHAAALVALGYKKQPPKAGTSARTPDKKTAADILGPINPPQRPAPAVEQTFAQLAHAEAVRAHEARAEIARRLAFTTTNEVAATPSGREQLAHHEAGHAVAMACVTGDTCAIRGLKLFAPGQSDLGATLLNQLPVGMKVADMLVIIAAGQAAVHLWSDGRRRLAPGLRDTIPLAIHGDLEQAGKLLGGGIDRHDPIWAEAVDKAYVLLRNRMPVLSAVARALNQQGELTGQQFRTIFDLYP